MKLQFKHPTSANLAEINQLVWAAKASWGYAEELLELWRSSLTITTQALQQREFWLARNEAGVAIALYSIRLLQAGSAELEDFWLSPEVKGKGYGRQMFSHLRRQLAKRQVKRLTIISDPHAEGFYTRMGAVRAGLQPSEPKGRTLPVLVLTL